MPTALIGVNGNSGINISSSVSLSLSFFTENNKEISIQKTRIVFWIPRKENINLPIFQHINIANLTKQTTNDLTNIAINLKSPNSSIHINIKPLIQISYLICLKYRIMPVLNQTHRIYDDCDIFCPLGD